MFEHGAPRRRRSATARRRHSGRGQTGSALMIMIMIVSSSSSSSSSSSIYIYIYIYIMYVYIYMYIYIYREREIERECIHTHGVTANLMLLDRWTFGVLPLAYFYHPKVPGRTFFPKLSTIITFCSGPISVDPVCPQSRR